MPDRLVIPASDAAAASQADADGYTRTHTRHRAGQPYAYVYTREAADTKPPDPKPTTRPKRRTSRKAAPSAKAPLADASTDTAD
ncbi:MAG: hypothetical protein AAFU38_09360 [Bacteroidota bacterium]